ncbi:MAG: YbbR-like domain-containing protein, partial [bacterium]
EREKHVQILPWHVQHPPGLEVVDIQPRSIRVLLEMKIDKVVAVEPDFRGEKDEDLNYSIEVDPDTALVAGVRSELQDLETIFLSEIQLPGLENSPLQTEISARLPGSMDLVEPSENIFSLRVEVSEPEKERVIADVPVRIQNIPEGRSGVVDPGSVDIKVRGPQNTVEDLDAEDITAFVNAPEDDGPEIKVIRFDLPSRVRQVEDADVTRTAKVRLVD